MKERKLNKIYNQFTFQSYILLTYAKITLNMFTTTQESSLLSEIISLLNKTSIFNRLKSEIRKVKLNFKDLLFGNRDFVIMEVDSTCCFEGLVSSDIFN